jgi:hypothetical protein
MFPGGDVDFSRLVGIVFVELPSWRRIATLYIHFNQHRDKNMIEVQ